MKSSVFLCIASCTPNTLFFQRFGSINIPCSKKIWGCFVNQSHTYSSTSSLFSNLSPPSHSFMGANKKIVTGGQIWTVWRVVKGFPMHFVNSQPMISFDKLSNGTDVVICETWPWVSIMTFIFYIFLVALKLPGPSKHSVLRQCSIPKLRLQTS